MIRAVLIAFAVALSLAEAPCARAQAPVPGDSLGADWREQQNEARDTVRQGRHIPLERVIESLRRRMPGRLLDTGLETGPGGRAVYRVRWAAANGRRIDILIDAVTGATLQEQGR